MVILFVCCQWYAIQIVSSVIFLGYLLSYMQYVLIFHDSRYEHIIEFPLFVLMWVSIISCQSENYVESTSTLLGFLTVYVDFLFLK